MTITNKVSLKSVNGGNTPISDVVDAPTIGTATAGVESASVTFTAATTGGAATSYGAISTPDSIVGTSATSPITISGLTGGTSYTFKTYGINSAGTWSSVLSSSSNSVTPTDPSATFLIQRISGTGSSSTITFSSIPSTYKHLQIRCLVSTNAATTDSSASLRFNGDTSSNYTNHWLYGDGTSRSSSGNASQNKIQVAAYYTGASYSTDIHGASIIDIHDYSLTSKNKTVKGFNGWDANSAGYVNLISGLWMSTSAISSITLFDTSGYNFSSTSTFALYGIVGS